MRITGSERVRRSVIAGSWYPGTKADLQRTIDGYLAEAATTRLTGLPVGLISPHAGYAYSGRVAAHAYKQVMGLDFDRVVIVSPVHRVNLGRYAVTEFTHYETPLGQVAVDEEMVHQLGQELPIGRIGYDGEHSLEIQLPFLQRALPKFSLLPVMMGAQDMASCQALASAIARIVDGRKTLLVASTDLAHIASHQRTLSSDQVFLEDFGSYDVEALSRHLTTGETAACGGGPVIAVMLAARELGADRAQIIRHATSFDVTGDESYVVGYAAGLLFKSALQG